MIPVYHIAEYEGLQKIKKEKRNFDYY